MRIGLTAAERVHQRVLLSGTAVSGFRVTLDASPSYRVAHVGVSDIGRDWKNSWISAQVKTLVLVAWHLAGGFAAQLKYAHIFFIHLYRSSMPGFKPDLVGNVPERYLILRNFGYLYQATAAHSTRQHFSKYFFENFRTDWNFVVQLVMSSHLMVSLLWELYTVVLPIPDTWMD